ncbi:MAG TPA: ATP-binding cassette domain-containing protein [Thermoanaerobaculia bacterium]|jgi:ABC-type multidrug transport system ATPase subunit|nr:ATP-binding cassette domain-containing protein [Thermoanaerobaculia bacterium]HEV8609194.1 ATP-binding cassette domain-containing protein [Thermoanaerobaculia bacterium]
MKDVVRALGLSKSYGARSVLRDVDFSLREGEIAGLIGANGAGKTTLLRILLGLVCPTAGRVEWRGADAAPPRDRVGHFGGAHTLPPAVAARTWVRLVSRGRDTSDDRRPVRALSRGSRQLLGLSAELARTDLDALLFDEPWEGLDPDGSRWLSDSLRRKREEGCAFLVSSHRLHDLAGLCDRYAFLLDCRVVTRAARQISPHTVRGEDLLAAFDLIRCSP